MEFLRSFLRRHFAGRSMGASRNVVVVVCLLRLRNWNYPTRRKDIWTKEKILMIQMYRCLGTELKIWYPLLILRANSGEVWNKNLQIDLSWEQTFLGRQNPGKSPSLTSSATNLTAWRRWLMYCNCSLGSKCYKTTRVKVGPFAAWHSLGPKTFR